MNKNNNNNVSFDLIEKSPSDRTLQLNLIEENSLSIIRAVHRDEVANCGEYEAAIIGIKKVNIDSAILSASSSFFRKLFSNGMRESQLKIVPLTIAASELECFMDLMAFMHGKELNVSSARGWMDVLVMGDKYDVPSCKKFCIKQLLEMPITKELAELCLKLPDGVLMGVAGKQLQAAAEVFIKAHKSQEKVPTKHLAIKMKPKYE